MMKFVERMRPRIATRFISAVLSLLEGWTHAVEKKKHKKKQTLT